MAGLAPFWVVVEDVPELRCRVRHPTYQEAKTEAERLAVIHPGKTFWVLGAQGKAQAPRVLWELTDNNIPF